MQTAPKCLSFLVTETQSQAFGCACGVSERHWFKIPSLLENMCVIRNLGEFSLSLHTLMYKLQFFFYFWLRKTNFQIHFEQTNTMGGVVFLF